jgi:hypothetical protein
MMILAFSKVESMNLSSIRVLQHMSFAIQRHKNFIDDKAKKRVYKKHKDATSALVAKISAGVKKSPFTKRGIKDGYDACQRAAAKRNKAQG